MNVKRIPSGIPGLDSRIEGGFPINSTIVMLSDASNYTEMTLQQFAHQGLMDGHPALYITISRPPEKVMTSMRLQGMDVDKYAESRRLVFVDLYSRVDFMQEDDEELPAVEENVVSIQDIDSPEMVMMAINAGLGTLGDLDNIRMVVDSTQEILSGLSMIEFLRFWRTVGNNLSRYDLNIFFNFPTGIKEDFFKGAAHHADVILRLTRHKDGPVTKTHLQIDKMRFTCLDDSGLLELSMEDKRAKVFNYNKIR